MADESTILRLFVASPGDVAAEREAVVRVAEELNSSLSAHFGARLEVLRSETHTSTGIGDYAQAVINRQIGDKYDVLIGIMAQYPGSPTKKAPSGTQEEFDRALQRYRKDPESVTIQFYFKDAPVRPSAIDIGDLAKVRRFERRLQQCGVYYERFESVAGLEKLLRRSLITILGSVKQGSAELVGHKHESEVDPRILKALATKLRGLGVRGEADLDLLRNEWVQAVLAADPRVLSEQDAIASPKAPNSATAASRDSLGLLLALLRLRAKGVSKSAVPTSRRLPSRPKKQRR